MKLSLCLATYNEEQNVGPVLDSVKDLVDEMIVIDGSSTDKTAQIAYEKGAQVLVTSNPPIFHINKQKAMDEAKGDWILQLDADERVTPTLAKEIKRVIAMTDQEREEHQQNLSNRDLFLRHQQLIDERDGTVGKTEGPYVAYYLPRKNYFLGTFLRYGGVYPDGAIRLIKKGKAFLPCKDVHEVMVVAGRVGWLENDLLHYDSPTFQRYLERNSRYIDLMVQVMEKQQMKKGWKNWFTYVVVKPIVTFLDLQIRHKGILDGWQGIVFSFFSAIRFARAYLRYCNINYNPDAV
jgi:glycosyltransferase involved in cell wall biosynthesis